MTGAATPGSVRMNLRPRRESASSTSPNSFRRTAAKSSPSALTRCPARVAAASSYVLRTGSRYSCYRFASKWLYLRASFVSGNVTMALRGTILVVDDEGLARRSLVELLQEEGYQVHEAADGTTALHLLGEIDLISFCLTSPCRGRTALRC